MHSPLIIYLLASFKPEFIDGDSAAEIIRLSGGPTKSYPFHQAYATNRTKSAGGKCCIQKCIANCRTSESAEYYTFAPRKADGQLQPISVTYGHTNPGITPIYSIYVSTLPQSSLSTKRQVSEPNSMAICSEKGLQLTALGLSALNVILDYTNFSFK